MHNDVRIEDQELIIGDHRLRDLLKIRFDFLIRLVAGPLAKQRVDAGGRPLWPIQRLNVEIAPRCSRKLRENLHVVC